ncbi:MAG TPA: AMP-binding protein [Bacteroidota bacterium]|nr:AMP-binding protein [Bacteroidota bacterium]
MSISRYVHIDDQTGRRVTYRELFQILSEELIIPRVVRSYDTFDILVAIIAAAVYGENVILCDPEWSEEEILGLGITSQEMNERSVLVGITVNADTLIAKYHEETGGSITFLTSGTTGIPKRITQPVGKLMRSVRFDEKYHFLNWALAFHPSHIAGVQVMLQAVATNGTLIPCFNLDVNTLGQVIEAREIHCISATPTFYRTRFPATACHSKVKRVTSGGERLDRTLLRRLGMLFPNATLRNIYATTESGTLLTSNTDVFTLPANLSERVKVSEHELCVWNDAEGEWRSTGDIVEVVQNDPVKIRLIGRSGDVVVVGGYNVSVVEVEDVIRLIPGVTDAVVRGIKSSVLGNMLEADVIVEDPSITEVILHERLSSAVAPYKVPRVFNIVSTMPITRTGKRKRI